MSLRSEETEQAPPIDPDFKEKLSTTATRLVEDVKMEQEEFNTLFNTLTAIFSDCLPSRNNRVNSNKKITIFRVPGSSACSSLPTVARPFSV